MKRILRQTTKSESQTYSLYGLKKQHEIALGRVKAKKKQSSWGDCGSPTPVFLETANSALLSREEMNKKKLLQHTEAERNTKSFLKAQIQCKIESPTQKGWRLTHENASGSSKQQIQCEVFTNTQEGWAGVRKVLLLVSKMTHLRESLASTVTVA